MRQLNQNYFKFFCTSVSCLLQLICYYEQSKWDSPSNIDELIADGSHCTHIVQNLQIDSIISDSSETNGTDSEVLALQQKGIRISVGIETDRGFFKYDAQQAPETLAHYVKSINKFIKRHQIDGLAIFHSKEESAQSLLDFVRQVSEAFQPHGFLLTVTAANRILVNPDFDVKKLSK